MTGDLVLGLGGCVDYEITWDAAVLQHLAQQYAIGVREVSPSVEVRTERDLVCSILGFLREGAGGERYVGASSVVEQFAARSRYTVALGGSNVRAALAMSRLGVGSRLHLVSVDDHVRRLLPDDVGYVCSAPADSTDPHLIVQYPAGACVRVGGLELRAPRGNRLIYVNDRPNGELALSPALGEMLCTAGIFLISGFNAMRDSALLARRLVELRGHLERLPELATVIYEDAEFHVPLLARQVHEALADRIDLWGMNEDELQAHVGRRVDLLDPDDVASALGQLRRVVRARTVVVHTATWALAAGLDGQALRQPLWGALREALQGGIVMAGARYRHGDTFTRAQHEDTARRARQDAGERFARELEARMPGRVCCEPALQLEAQRPTTVGLGDAFVGGFIAALAGR